MLAPDFFPERAEGGVAESSSTFWAPAVWPILNGETGLEAMIASMVIS